MKIRLESKAKINLFLDITARREDGYHIINTVYQLIDLRDSLEFEQGDQGIELISDSPDIPLDSTNIISRAITAVLKYKNIDNQGIRYELMPRLIEIGLDNEAEELYQQYEEDAGACWHYSRVLLDFRKSGDSVAATAALKKAVKNNKYVSDLLTGCHRLPLALPAFYKPGDDVEAAYYAFDNLPAWIKTPGALEWLASKSK